MQTQQQKQVYKGFLDFVESKPNGDIINHNTYCTCAIGDYSDELHGDRDDYELVLGAVQERDNTGGEDSLTSMMGNGASRNIPTYGRLKALLKRFPYVA